MHASFVIYEEKNGKFSSDDVGKLKELAYPKDPQSIRGIGFANGVKVLTKLIELIPKYKNSPKIAKIKLQFPKICSKLLELVEPSKKYRNVLCHGDLWINNLMFKYDEEKPIECKIIDFQLTRYAPPAMDLATFIFTSSSRGFRKLNVNEIINVFCNVIENELKAHNINLKALSRDEIFKSYEEFKIAGLIEATIFAHLILPDEIAYEVYQSSEEYEKFLSQCREKVCKKAFEVNYYRDRVTELLTELIDNFIVV